MKSQNFSPVRQNLLTRPGYSPYCGGQSCRSMPRTSFNGEQFECPDCGWKSNFDGDFIKKYLAAVERMREVT